MVVSGSLATLVGVVVALIVGKWWGFIDTAALSNKPGSYVVMQPGAIGLALLVILAVSYGLAATLALYGPGKGARVFPDSGWYAAFERGLPDDHGIKATVELRDGRKIVGVIRAFTAEQTPVDDRELTLVRSTNQAMKVLSPDGEMANLAEEFIVLRGSEILYVAATYVPVTH